MPKALLDISRCKPGECTDGRCAVRRVCAVRAIYQDEPFEAPIANVVAPKIKGNPVARVFVAGAAWETPRV